MNVLMSIMIFDHEAKHIWVWGGLLFFFF